MLFNSLSFLVFFIAVTALYYIVPHRYRWLLLLLASCIFYMALMPVYILILWAIIIIDYSTAFFIVRSDGRRRKLYLAISIMLNLGVLFFFKYYNFFLTSVSDLCAHYHLALHAVPYLHIILPLGLSFHTFQSMSYTIEVYKGRTQPERHFGLYALYVMFYPQLIAGPIERPQNILSQFHTLIPFRYENLLQGLRLMLWGLFKKVVVADRVSVYANVIFDDPGRYHNLQVLVGVLAFTVQIYCDFSGYTDIALGAARCMGYTLMINFHRPYFAGNIREFWARWHISLSTWFRDYVYIPLGGNRGRASRTYFNLLIVFLLSGFWHGANWTFIAWGLVHALYYLIFLTWQKLQITKSKMFDFAGWIVTFMAVSLAWIFFRAENMSKAWLILSRIFSADRSFSVFTSLEFFKAFSIALSILACMYVVLIEKVADPGLTWFDSRMKTDIIFCSITLILILCFGVFQQQSFIYFQF